MVVAVVKNKPHEKLLWLVGISFSTQILNSHIAQIFFSTFTHSIFKASCKYDINSIYVDAISQMPCDEAFLLKTC